MSWLLGRPGDGVMQTFEGRGLLILPREVSDGRGFYDDSVVTLASRFALPA
jgi:hypothetical protein